MEILEQETSRTLLRSERVGTGVAFGTFGELLQGRNWEENLDFLVTLPITCCSYATFVTDPNCTSITVFPSYKQKSKTLASMLLEHVGLPQGGKLTIQSELPIGKGLASSSADLVATARSICSCFHIKLPPSLLATLMCKIEPSDGVMYPGVVSFYHREGRLREFLGYLPPIVIISIDEGGELDTVQFNQRPKPFTRAEEIKYQTLLDALAVAIRQQDVSTIGRIATESAILNQKLNPKRTLNDLLTVSKEINGLGVAVAHSGTCLGILLSPNAPNYHNQVQVAYHHLSALARTVSIYRSFNFYREKEQYAS